MIFPTPANQATVYVAALLLLAAYPAVAADCSPEQLQQILAPANAQQHSIEVRCSATLPPGSTVSKRLYFSGSAASGLRLNCNGVSIAPTHSGGGDALVIRSVQQNGTWSVPADIAVNSCRIVGSVRVMGMGSNGEAAAVRASSQQAGHTERAQAAAPGRIAFDKLTIIGQGRVPLYLAPGVHHVTVSGSRITGNSNSVAVYLDAESAHNTFTGNTIDTATASRELIAIDGSARNTFKHNRFSSLNRGGLYFYRNCGEGGTVRHQTPSYNTVADNVFFYRKYNGKLPAVWLGARNGNRNYCHADHGFAFGSSADNRDFADHNLIERNQIHRLPPQKMIRDEGAGNQIRDNQTVN